MPCCVSPSWNGYTVVVSVSTQINWTFSLYSPGDPELCVGQLFFIPGREIHPSSVGWRYVDGWSYACFIKAYLYLVRWSRRSSPSSSNQQITNRREQITVGSGSAGQHRYFCAFHQRIQLTTSHRYPPGMVWYGMVWYGMVWYYMVWYGVVWYGMILHGMVWYGMV